LILFFLLDAARCLLHLLIENKNNPKSFYRSKVLLSVESISIDIKEGTKEMVVEMDEESDNSL
jgi:hypothetical protein